MLRFKTLKGKLCYNAVHLYLYGDEKHVKDAKDFIKSEVFSALTGVDGTTVLKRLDELKREEAQ